MATTDSPAPIPVVDALAQGLAEVKEDLLVCLANLDSHLARAELALAMWCSNDPEEVRHGDHR